MEAPKTEPRILLIEDNPEIDTPFQSTIERIG